MNLLSIWKQNFDQTAILIFPVIFVAQNDSLQVLQIHWEVATYKI